MPASYQSPMRKDKTKGRTHSQSVTTNVQTEHSTVAQLLKGKGQDVFAVSPHDTLETAVRELRDKRIGALIVKDDSGALCGILSERDIVQNLAATPGQTLQNAVQDVMTTKVETCGPAETLVSVLHRMTEGRFRHMPVVDGGALQGMVTIGDVVSFRLVELEHASVRLKQLLVG